jgi:hypothetical protein
LDDVDQVGVVCAVSVLRDGCGRDFCEYLFSPHAALRGMASLSLAHVPDEKYFPSLLVTSPFRHTFLRCARRGA